MREIKFRAWNTLRNEMDIVSSMSFCEDYVVLINSKGKKYSSIKNHIAIPMQYTGVIDGNGREVYEGDIIISELLERKYIVVFEKGSFYAKNNKFMWLISELIESNAKILVAGNIYENKELMENIE